MSQNVCRRRKPIQLKRYQDPNRESGYYLVEALVCCLIVGIISAGMADGYAKIQSFSTHAQTELQAVAIAQECIDQVRSQQFSFIQANLGQHLVPIVGNSSTGDLVFPRPLLRDTQAMNYFSPAMAGGPIVTYAQAAGSSSKPVDDRYNYLQVPGNAVTVNLTAGANAAAINVQVIVSWNDGNGPHTYEVDTTVAASGLNG